MTHDGTSEPKYSTARPASAAKTTLLPDDVVVVVAVLQFPQESGRSWWWWCRCVGAATDFQANVSTPDPAMGIRITAGRALPLTMPWVTREGRAGTKASMAMPRSVRTSRTRSSGGEVRLLISWNTSYFLSRQQRSVIEGLVPLNEVSLTAQ